MFTRVLHLGPRFDEISGGCLTTWKTSHPSGLFKNGKPLRAPFKTRAGLSSNAWAWHSMSALARESEGRFMSNRLAYIYQKPLI